MFNNLEELLNITLTELTSLNQVIESLIETYPYPEDFDKQDNSNNDNNIKKTIRESYNDFRIAYQEAVERLKKPSLSIAMIGTTSSGKSTIINALVGHEIAPIEAQETSAGILTIKHSNTEQSELNIEDTKNAKWETGKHIGLTDEGLYNKIGKDVMQLYREKRKIQEDIEAPRITVFVKLLPVCDSSLLGLPLGVDVEFIDLPGLKSTKDDRNLKVIQQRVNKAFSIVALDYSQVDEEHRQALLKELQQAVEYQQGRTDSIIFILNKVNLRDAKDLPLEERISQLQEEIQTILSLPEKPEILPFNSLLLYYVQCAWGSAPLSQSSLVDPAIRVRLLKNMFNNHNCFGALLNYRPLDQEWKFWILDIQSMVNKDEHIDDEKMRRIVEYAFEWTYGKLFWNTLRSRIKESFPQLVLLPALTEVFLNCDVLDKTTNFFVNIRKTETKEEINQKVSIINNIRISLPNSITDINEKFTTNIKKITDALREAVPTSVERDKSITKLKEQGINSPLFTSLFEIFGEVETNLTALLIAPLKEAFKENKEVSELKKQLNLAIEPALVEKIARSYESLRKTLPEFTSVNGYLEKKVRVDNIEEKEKLDNVEKTVIKLYIFMKKALTARARFVIQGQSQKIETIINSLIDAQKSELNTILQKEKKLNNLTVLEQLEQAIDIAFQKQRYTNEISLPDTLFSSVIPRIEGYPKIEQVTIGQKTEGCFACKQRQEIKEDVPYYTKTLPNQETMIQDWSKGITERRQEIWGIICQWAIDSLEQSSQDFKNAALQVIEMANKTLDSQYQEIENGRVVHEQAWIEVENKLASIQSFKNKLKQKSRKLE